MQATLLDELQDLAHRPEDEGSQFLVNTHAPNLVPPAAIDRVSRFTFQDWHTIRRALDVRDEDGKEREAGDRDVREIGQDELVKLRKMLRGNLAARALLFSRAVLMIEGSTELTALPVWCADLVRQDIALYPVDGKGGFVSPLRLIFAWGLWTLKTWAFWLVVAQEVFSLIRHLLEFARPDHSTVAIVLGLVLPVVILLYFLVDPNVRAAFFRR